MKNTIYKITNNNGMSYYEETFQDLDEAKRFCEQIKQDEGFYNDMVIEEWTDDDTELYIYHILDNDGNWSGQNTNEKTIYYSPECENGILTDEIFNELWQAKKFLENYLDETGKNPQGYIVAEWEADEDDDGRGTNGDYNGIIYKIYKNEYGWSWWPPINENDEAQQ